MMTFTPKVIKKWFVHRVLAIVDGRYLSRTIFIHGLFRWFQTSFQLTLFPLCYNVFSLPSSISLFPLILFSFFRHHHLPHLKYVSPLSSLLPQPSFLSLYITYYFPSFLIFTRPSLVSSLSLIVHFYLPLTPSTSDSLPLSIFFFPPPSISLSLTFPPS